MNGAQACTSAVPQPNFDALVRRHTGLVRRIAYHLAGRLPPQVEVDDLLQSGMMGLLEAAQHFTAKRSASFETYAGMRIRGAMLDALRKLDWAPRSVRREARAAAAAMRAVEGRTGCEGSDADIAAQLGVSLEQYHGILQNALSCQLLRLNDTSDDEESTLDRLPHNGPDPQSEALHAAQLQAVTDAISNLPERERLVFSLYYEQEMYLAEIAAVLGLTESRICQIHGKALVRLKALLVDWCD